MAPKRKRKRKQRPTSTNPALRAQTSVGGNQERFTETIEQFQARLRRERIIGGLVLAIAMVVLLLNLVMEVAPEVILLPGGHSELYFLGSSVVAGAAAWIVLDLGNNRRVRR